MQINSNNTQEDKNALTELLRFEKTIIKTINNDQEIDRKSWEILCLIKKNFNG